MQAVHSKKLEQALRSHERFPINLEWMVDVFKYKHISSLTTHLKRHFKMNVHYKRFAQEQNKRVWTYFISVECFIGICEYVRHAARKKIANVWLRKVGIKGTTRRIVRDYEDDTASFSEDDIEDDDEEEDEYDIDEEVEPRVYEREYDYYEEAQSPAKRRRLEEDEEYQCEDDDEEDAEERTYFQEMEEEEEACAEYDTDTSADYESSSSSQDSPAAIRRSSSLTVSTTNLRIFTPNALANAQFRIIPSSSSEELNSSSDSTSSPASSVPSTPTSSPPSSPSSPPRVQPVPLIKPQVPECEVVPANAIEMCKEQVDWSYLHLRPNPHPLGTAYDFPAKYFASLMFGPQSQYCAYPQQFQPYAYMFAPGAFVTNYPAAFGPNMVVDPNGYPMRPSRLDMDNLHGDLSNMEERQFDTNMFLSIPEEHQHHYLTHRN